HRQGPPRQGSHLRRRVRRVRGESHQHALPTAGEPLLRAGLHGNTAASPLWAIDLMGGYVAGETVLVQGPGPIGLIAVQLCKALGAARVILTGTRDSRLAIGEQLGADHTINIRTENLRERVREITGGRGADCVLECAGGPSSMQEALENVKRGGRIGVVAWYAGPVEVDMNLAVRS